MLIGVIADDFTGASDIANTLAKGLPERGGVSTALYLGVPLAQAGPGVVAGVVALKSRSVPAEAAVSQSLDALRWLQAQGCRQIVFKYCSTFDSTPEGNIGPVAEALAEALGVRGVVVCPAFPTVGRTVYQGHLFVRDRLLSESGMQDHPLTPMTDPDLRRWLGRQIAGPVGHADLTTVRSGATALSARLRDAEARGERLVVVDAIEDEDLLTIARASADAPLLTGGSGIALGLPDNLIGAGLAPPAEPAFAPIAAPAFVLSGSCSQATRGQVARHLEGHPGHEIDVAALMEGRLTAAHLLAFLEEHAGATPLVYSSSAPDDVRALQQQFGAKPVADRLDSLFATVAALAVEAGFGRVIVAGGETSGAVATTVGGALQIGREIDPGVPVLIRAEPAGPLALALKSGNFGAVDFFERAAAVMAGTEAG